MRFIFLLLGLCCTAGFVNAEPTVFMREVEFPDTVLDTQDAFKTWVGEYGEVGEADLRLAPPPYYLVVIVSQKAVLPDGTQIVLRRAQVCTIKYDACYGGVVNFGGVYVDLYSWCRGQGITERVSFAGGGRYVNLTKDLDSAISILRGVGSAEERLSRTVKYFTSTPIDERVGGGWSRDFGPWHR